MDHDNPGNYQGGFPMSRISLDHLFEIAHGLGAQIGYQDLHAIHPQLDAYTRLPLVMLDKSLTSNNRHHKCILAEEIGHLLFPPRAGHVSYHIGQSWDSLKCQDRYNVSVLVAQDERKALAWATDLLIPDDTFWEFAEKGPHLLYEWLEEFDVAMWFFEIKVGIILVRQPIRGRLKWIQTINRRQSS